MLESAHIAMKHYRHLGDVQYKSDNSPLTAADLEIDRLIHHRLKQAFPDIAIITEEQADTHKALPEGAPFFLVDPIDGTKEFINQRDEFTINIGLIENGLPVLGLVAAPAKSTLYIGCTGRGAARYELDMVQNTISEPVPIQPANPDNNALNIVASRSHLCDNTRDFIKANKVGRLVNAGSSLKFCLLAAGEADLYPRFGPTMEWDTAAGHAVLASVGGIVEVVDKKPLAYGKKNLTNSVFLAYVPGTVFNLAG